VDFANRDDLELKAGSDQDLVASCQVGTAVVNVSGSTGVPSPAAEDLTVSIRRPLGAIQFRLRRPAPGNAGRAAGHRGVSIAVADQGGKMKKTVALVILALVATVAASFASPAHSITGPNAVVSDRDNVVLVTFYDEEGVYLWRCSGTLIAPTIVLTAGHCTYGAAEAKIWADVGPYVETAVEDGGYPLSPVEDRPPCEGYEGWPCEGEDATGEPITYPGFGFPGIVPPEDASFPNTGDVGLVILDTAITPDTGFASLAEAGALDVFATRRGRQDVTFTVVGYGLQRTLPTGDIAERIRLEATTQLVNLKSSLTAGFNLQTSANPGGGRGGTCFGDSGGPVFYGDSNVIVAITSFGLSPNCTGVDYAFRIDQADVLAWILEVAEDEGETITVVPLP
jgi:hypothetical protein